MLTEEIFRHRTAIRRGGPSLPVRLALRDEIIRAGDSILDYGCGQGEDVEFLSSLRYRCGGWDPYYRPEASRAASEVVNLGYVLNVIEDAEERAATLVSALRYAKRALVASAQVGCFEQRSTRYRPYRDGFISSRQTFQKYYSQGELAEFLADATKLTPYAAATGIFYLFPDAEAELAYCRRYAEESATAGELPQLTSEWLNELVQFVRIYRRPPDPDDGELWRPASLLLLSDDWYRILQSHLEPEFIAELRAERREAILAKLCSSLFAGRLRMGELTLSERAEVKAHFRNLNIAYSEADAYFREHASLDAVVNALAACKLGKTTRAAHYFHSSLLPLMPAPVRLLVGAAQAILPDELGWQPNLIKVGLTRSVVSLAHYPAFENDAHPALSKVYLVDFEEGRHKILDYSQVESPPILHRKELFVGPDHPDFTTFQQLSRDEDAAGLLSRSDIGTLGAWLRVLSSAGFEITGHTLIGERRHVAPSADVDGSEPELWNDTDAQFVPIRRKIRDRPAKVGKRVIDRIAQLQQLGQLTSALGRLPVVAEFNGSKALLQSLQRSGDWHETLKPYIDANAYERTYICKLEGWLVRLCLNRYRREQALSFRSLDPSEQADIRAFFGSFMAAIAESEKALHRVGSADIVDASLWSAGVGRLDEKKGLYIHYSAVDALPMVLRLVVTLGEYLAHNVLMRRPCSLRIGFGARNLKFYDYDDFLQPAAARLLTATKIDFKRRKVVARNHEDDLIPSLLFQRSDYLLPEHPAAEALKAWESKTLITTSSVPWL